MVIHYTRWLKKALSMLYVAVCKECNHMVEPTQDVNLLKQRIASHMTDSHKYDYPDFVADLPLRELSDGVFSVVRFRDEYYIASFLHVYESPKWWDYFRNIVKLARQRA